MLPWRAVELHQAKLIAFDNDGTLYPAGPAVGEIVLSAHREYVRTHGLDIPTPDRQWLNYMIGADAKEFYAAMMPGQPDHVRREFEDFCLEYELQAVREHPYMYDGAEEVLHTLHDAGRYLVLVTNGGPTYVQNVWDTCGYARFFDGCYPYGPPDFATKGERLAQALADFGNPPAVMVGDRFSDLEAAREAGTGFIGCAYGYSQPGELAEAVTVINSISELYNLLLAPGERK